MSGKRERGRRPWRRRGHLGVWDPTGGEAREGSGLPVEKGEEQIRAVLRSADGEVREVDPGEIEELLSEPGTVLWIDVLRPHERARALLEDALGLEPLTVEDCLSPLRMPKIDLLHDERGELEGAFVAAFAASMEWGGGEAAHLRAVEVDLVVGRNYLVTVRDTPLREVERRIGERLRNGGELLEEAGAGALAHAALDAMVDGHLPALVGAASAAEELEERLDPENERRSAAAFEALISLRRDLSAFRRLALAQQESLRRFGRMQREIEDYLDDVVDNQREAVDMADAARDYVDGVIETYRSRRDERTERGIRRLTGIAAILGILTLFSGIYGMNFSYLPGARDPEGFWIFIATQVVFAAAGLFYLRWRRLL